MSEEDTSKWMPEPPSREFVAEQVDKNPLYALRWDPAVDSIFSPLRKIMVRAATKTGRRALLPRRVDRNKVEEILWLLLYAKELTRRARTLAFEVVQGCGDSEPDHAAQAALDFQQAYPAEIVRTFLLSEALIYPNATATDVALFKRALDNIAGRLRGYTKATESEEEFDAVRRAIVLQRALGMGVSEEESEQIERSRWE